MIISKGFESDGNKCWWENKYIIPNKNPKSPNLVTKKAFFAAFAADGLWNQNPINR